MPSATRCHCGEAGIGRCVDCGTPFCRAHQGKDLVAGAHVALCVGCVDKRRRRRHEAELERQWREDQYARLRQPAVAGSRVVAVVRELASRLLREHPELAAPIYWVSADGGGPGQAGANVIGAWVWPVGDLPWLDADGADGAADFAEVWHPTGVTADGRAFRITDPTGPVEAKRSKAAVAPWPIGHGVLVGDTGTWPMIVDRLERADAGGELPEATHPDAVRLQKRTRRR